MLRHARAVGASADQRGRSHASIAAYAIFLLILAGSLRAASPRAYLDSSPQPNEESRMRTLQNLGVVSSIALSASLAPAQDAVQWRVEDGGNGHWYALFTSSRALPWADADSYARERGAHLACITSSEENAFVLSIDASNQVWQDFGPWLGGYQLEGSIEPSGGWQWVTGEAWDWAEWSVQPLGEPNNAGCGEGPENRLHFVACQGADRHWNDAPESGVSQCCVTTTVVRGALVEWSADCNKDGVVDFGQIRAGQLDDLDGDNIPDCCEAGEVCVLNLITNGSFEIGPEQTDCTWVVHGTSSPFVPGWSVVAVSVDRERLSSACPPSLESWLSFDGEFTIDLDGGAAGGAIAQTIPTTQGQTYRLTFQLTGNCAPGTKRMRVEAAEVVADFEHVCQASNPQPWVQHSVDFTATGAATQVTLRSLSTDGRNGPVVDDVRVFEIIDNCPADIDQSGAINGVDLAAILNNWATSGGKQPRSDVNGDGIVDGADLAEVLNSWGACP